MDWSYLPCGIVIGLSVAAPIGPMALLCIRRTLAHGRVVGLVSGVGVATADAVYGAVAAFGLTSISSFLVDIQDTVRLGGGFFLCYLGWSIVRSQATEVIATADPRASDHAAAFVSTFGLTLTNPATVLTFAAIFSGFGVAAEGAGSGSAAALVAGVFAGSALWWLVLTTGTGKLRFWLTPARLTVINRTCGSAILVFGVLAILSAIR